MKKFPLIFSGLLLAMLAGPKLSGTLLKSNLDNLVQRIDSMPGYRASLEQIENGWFSSQSNLTIHFDVNELQHNQDMPFANEFSLNIPIKAQHGPIIISPSFAIGLATFQSNFKSEEAIEGLTINDQDPYLYSVSGFISLFGTATYNTKVPRLTFIDPDSSAAYTQTEWIGKGVMASDFMSFETKTPLNAVMQANGFTFLEINEISLDYMADAGLTQIYEQVLYDGTFNFAIDSISFENPDSNENVKVENIAMRMTTTFDENTKLGDLSIQNEVSLIKTEEYLIENMMVTYAMNNISQRFIKKYQTLADKILNDPSSAEVNTRDFLAQELLPQLQSNPELNISKIQADINNARIDGFINSKLTGINALPPTLEDPAFWMQHSLINGNFKVQEKAAVLLAQMIIKTQLANNLQFSALSYDQQTQIISQQALATLDNLVQSKMLNKTEDGYEIVLKLSDGNLDLNGNQIPL